uniref:Uncharacterized protein n=1 Tax=Tanacetum cinerariifolium TaxID=118510 RepID=A0A6L2MCY3_TANCI|nr:hypothetical protein [Tanacetum cinerariifolium]
MAYVYALLDQRGTPTHDGSEGYAYLGWNEGIRLSYLCVVYSGTRLRLFAGVMIVGRGRDGIVGKSGRKRREEVLQGLAGKWVGVEQ